MESVENQKTGMEDVTQDFLSLSGEGFVRRLRELRSKAELVIRADLSGVTNVEEFKAKARLAKAFLQFAPEGQERAAHIRATKEQVAWEPNAFSSGIELIEV